MVVITSSQLATLRQAVADDEPNVDYTKAEINAALQAIEVSMRTAGIPALSSAINTATAPYVFSAAQKARLFKMWCIHFAKEN